MAKKKGSNNPLDAIPFGHAIDSAIAQMARGAAGAINDGVIGNPIVRGVVAVPGQLATGAARMVSDGVLGYLPAQTSAPRPSKPAAPKVTPKASTTIPQPAAVKYAPGVGLGIYGPPMPTKPVYGPPVPTTNYSPAASTPALSPGAAALREAARGVVQVQAGVRNPYVQPEAPSTTRTFDPLGSAPRVFDPTATPYQPAPVAPSQPEIQPTQVIPYVAPDFFMHAFNGGNNAFTQLAQQVTAAGYTPTGPAYTQHPQSTQSPQEAAVRAAINIGLNPNNIGQNTQANLDFLRRLAQEQMAAGAYPSF